jgi:SNF2 family DNA or RNA helicase
MQAIELGQIVRVRSRQYLVEEVTQPLEPDGDTLVRLSCVEDDAQGQQLEVFWEREIDAKILGGANWETILHRGFDDPRYFSAYLHTLRWNCVTSTNPKLFQAPYRAGIEVKTYQLEPLRKALEMPRVSLFIADDVGLGKTIEAGLILREMLIRQKIRRVVISCPPSVVRQWQEEMESRFGLIFQVFDREFVTAKRRERGYGVNPWTTHTRFIISHALLRDESYAASLRDWLGDLSPSPGAMLILDEAHNAAPASSARYAIDSQLTKSVRELAPKFEHKLFLSATPHNGHSNSFAALLEMLDPQRFCRGVPVKSQKILDRVMVRRLKRDLRELGDKDFPERQVIPIRVDGLPSDAPELVLAQLLQEYRQLREESLKDKSKTKQTAAMLVIICLQKRLLSSIEAFCRTLKVHRQTIEKQASKVVTASKFPLLQESTSSDDDRAELPELEIESEEDSQMARATQAGGIEISQRERDLLAQMGEIADRARYQTDGRIHQLIEWVRQHQCPDLGKAGAEWLERRVIIFTEYTDTKRYLEQQLKAAIAGSDLEDRRIDSFHGGMGGEQRRDRVKAAFNSDPTQHPLRILIATDAAREGINLQNHCADLFHFDIPWNPSRMEQRNGRIDRKLQREAVVRCYYFVLTQRTEDRVLDVLVAKTATIQRELGSLSPVVEKNIHKYLERGIQTANADQLIQQIEQVGDLEPERDDLIQGELEVIRPHLQKLQQQQQELEDMLKTSQEWLNLRTEHFREALNVSLEMVGGKPLAPLDSQAAIADLDRARWTLPLGDNANNPVWEQTLDTLRPSRQKGQKLWEWRKENEIRPVVFRDPGTLDGEVVHLHLEHRLVQRLLSRFRSQGFTHHELSRACVCLTDRAVPQVLILGRLSIYGDRATRLHDEIVVVAADWLSPEARGKGKLRPLSETEKATALELVETSLANPRLRDVPPKLLAQFQVHAVQDVAELLPHLKKRAEELSTRAAKKLLDRGQKEAKEMTQLLIEQRDRILEQEAKSKTTQLSLFNLKEQEQLGADIRHWQKRLAQIDRELDSEPQRIEGIYQVKASRIDPVGIVYLYPVSG